MGHREKQTVKYEAFAAIAEKLDVSVADLVEATGQTRGNANSFIKRGWVSKTTYLAAEGILRRSKKEATGTTLLLVAVPNGKLEMFQELTDSLNFKVVNVGLEVV